MLESLARAYPQVKSTLIDERDIYLSQKLRETQGNSVVAVVGAGHVPGIKQHIDTDEDLDPLMIVPRPGIGPRLIKWLIPLVIIALLALGFMRGGVEESVTSHDASGFWSMACSRRWELRQHSAIR